MMRERRAGIKSERYLPQPPKDDPHCHEAERDGGNRKDNLDRLRHLGTVDCGRTIPTRQMGRGRVLATTRPRNGFAEEFFADLGIALGDTF
jgi:hypothetical protein